MIPSPCKTFGGKGAFQGKLAKWIISLMPPRDQWLHYVEPYFGGGSVLLANDPEGISEVVNDLNFDLIVFWRVMSDESVFKEFLRIVQATPFSEDAWNQAGEPHVLKPNEMSVSAIATAAKFFIRCRQSLSGRMKDFATLSKTRVRRGMNEQASAWWTAIEGLPEVYERMKRVVIVGPKPAVDVIWENDGPQTLVYADPPYCHETRSGGKEYGEFEMTAAQHQELLDLLSTLKGKFLLSGYHSKMYDDWAKQNGFECHEFKIPNNAAGGKQKKVMTEVIWRNFKCQ